MKSSSEESSISSDNSATEADDSATWYSKQHYQKYLKPRRRPKKKVSILDKKLMKSSLVKPDDEKMEIE